MKELKKYIKESIDSSSKRVNEELDFDIIYYTETLIGAEAASVAIRINNASEIHKIFGTAKMKIDDSWVSIDKAVKDQYNSSIDYVILCYDSRDELSITMAEEDEVEMAIEDAEFAQESGIFDYDDFVNYVKRNIGVNIKGTYIKY